MLVGWEGHHLYVPVLATLHTIVHEGEGEDVDVHTGLEHQVLYHQQLDHVRLHILGRRGREGGRREEEEEGEGGGGLLVKI